MENQDWAETGDTPSASPKWAPSWARGMVRIDLSGAIARLLLDRPDKLNAMDRQFWPDLRAGLDFMPSTGMPVTTNYHSWWLAERQDGLYMAGGALLARVAGGSASRHIGHELDVQVARPLTPQLQLAGGYAHIVSGNFLKEATPGASYSYAYMMLTYVFLSEK